jgi:hypothetical protein
VKRNPSHWKIDTDTTVIRGIMVIRFILFVLVMISASLESKGSYATAGVDIDAGNALVDKNELFYTLYFRGQDTISLVPIRNQGNLSFHGIRFGVQFDF